MATRRGDVKVRLDGALANLTQCLIQQLATLPIARGGTSWSSPSLPTQAILCSVLISSAMKFHEVCEYVVFQVGCQGEFLSSSLIFFMVCLPASSPSRLPQAYISALYKGKTGLLNRGPEKATCQKHNHISSMVSPDS